MSNIFITDIVGQNDYAIPTDDTELGTATSGLDTLLSGVANLSYDRVLAWVEDSGGPDGAEGVRSLNCLVEKFTYLSKECPSESQVDTMIAAIESALEADADITSIGQQQVHIFQAGAYFLWNRDSSGGFLYPNTATDDVAVGPFAAPTGKWFDDGDLVLGAAAMSGTEKLRVVGSARIDTNGQLLIADSGTIPPLNLTERSAAPSAPSAGDIYLDDGTNTASGSPGWRRYTGAAWEDIGAVGGASLWTQGVGFAYLTATGESVVIGDNALTGTEKLKVDGGDILLEGGNLSLPDTLTSAAGVIQFNATPQMHVYGTSSIHLGGGGNMTSTSFDDCVLIGDGAGSNFTAGANISNVIAIGSNAMGAVGGSYGNAVVIGVNAAASVTGIGSQTIVVIGNNALNEATSTRQSVIIGQLANRDGNSSDNVVIGFEAMKDGANSTTHSKNVIIGSGAVADNTIGDFTGPSNVAIGYWAGRVMTSADSCVFVGESAGSSITTGDDNIAIGQDALGANNTGAQNVSIGYRSMRASSIAIGAMARNVAVGNESLQYIAASTDNNIAIGYRAMYHVDDSGAVNNNVAIGYECMDEAHGSENCVAVGYQAMDAADASDEVVAIGYQAGRLADSASGCIYIGYQAGTSNATANRLIIENSNDLTAPLIDGSFSGGTVTIHNVLTANTSLEFRGGGVSGVLLANGTQVVTTRQTGWAAPTGTSTRSGFATSTVTLSVLAEHVKALLEDLGNTSGHGLIDV